MPQYNEAVIIDGSNDEIQLQVQGDAEQSEPLQTWETSAADPLAQVTADGRFQTGDIGLETADALIEAHRDDDSSGVSGLPKRGFHSAGYVGGLLNSLVSWVVQELTLIGNGDLDAEHQALRVRLSNQNTGTMGTGAKLRAALVEFINSGGSSSDPVPEASGLHVTLHNQTGAHLDTAYGIRVDVLNEGTHDPEKTYALHTGTGLVHLGDTLELQQQATDPATPPADVVRIYPKSDGKLYAKNDTGTEYDLTGGGGAAAPEYILIKDKKPQNTNGGPFTSGAWRTRVLTDVEVGDPGVRSGNVITLPAGTYRCSISCPARDVGRHQARLYNTSTSNTLVIGTSEMITSSSGVSTRSFIIGQFTVAAEQTLEIQHRCNNSTSGVGFGQHSNFEQEVYTVAEFWKVG